MPKYFARQWSTLPLKLNIKWPLVLPNSRTAPTELQLMRIVNENVCRCPRTDAEQLLQRNSVICRRKASIYSDGRL